MLSTKKISFIYDKYITDIIGIILFKKLFSLATINIVMLLTIVLLTGLSIVILEVIDRYKTKIR